MIEQGIYFNLSYDAYRADPAIANSDIKTFNENRAYYWHKKYNKLDDDSTAKRTGRMFHTYFLQPDEFFKEFKVKEGVKNTKLEGYIGEELLEEFKSYEEGLKKHKDYDLHFKGGYPEISIFYQSSQGAMIKARIDYLNLKEIVDLKTIAPGYDTTKITMLGIAEYLKYNLCDQQGWFYLSAVEMIKTLFKNGTIFKTDANEEQQDWLLRLCESEEHKVVFAFIEKKAPFLSAYACLRMGDEMRLKNKLRCATNLENIINCVQKGTDKEWAHQLSETMYFEDEEVYNAFFFRDL